MSSLAQLLQHGQSCWMDDLTRRMIESGSLARRVGEEGLRGITSNPSIFAEAIERGDDYARDIADAAVRHETPQQIYEDLTVSDIQNACDVLRPVYEGTQGADGFASLEVSPHLAHDTQGSIEEARRLWRRVDRPNLFIKIPGTAAGVPAIEQLLFDGININVTLLFSVARFEAVAEAYMRALERRLAAKRPIEGVASVASFFLSRIDVLVDGLLEQRIVPGRPPEPDPQALVGKAGIANAKLAYRKFHQNLASPRWKALAQKGARVQRVLWASTSTKNPRYPDLMYVEPLIG
ncbi:MAG TPA: transaldolase, partial [Steroidobacteraceae bacterium]|nr:transaldolase [Steroidobacteraceae bacterium]